MKPKTFRLPAAAAAVAALTFGLVTVQGTDDALAAPVTETKTLNHVCTVWGGNLNSTVSPDNVSVTYPEQVHPGDIFDVTVQPGRMRAGGEEMGRVKYDIALPSDVDVTDVRLGGGQSNIGGANVIVERVNASGAPDAAGPFARISGDGHTVNNGPKPGNDHPKDGLTVAKNTDFRLPAVTFTVTAPNVAGSTISAGVRGAGVPAGPKNDANIENTISFMEDGFWSNDAVFCNADASGRTLTSTQVVARGTETSFAETSTDLEVITGSGPTTLTANVTLDDGTPVTEGQVEFDFGDGSPRATVDVADGVATTTHAYPELGDRTPVPHRATARYLGVQGRTNPSEDTTTVTVNPVPRERVQATVSLTGEAKVADAAEGRVPVELRAAVGAEDGKSLPEGVEVTFFEGDREVGRAAVADGAAATTVTVPDEKATRSFRAVVADMETETQELTGAEATVDVDVAPVSRTSVAVELGEDGVLVGREATITARYSATPSVPAGTEVIFRADGVRIGTATAGSDGTATIGHAFDAAGPKRITALVEQREVDGRVYPRAESGAVVLTVAAPAGRDTTTDLTYTRPDVDVEAEVLTGDLIRFTATVDAAGSAIEEGSTVSFFDGETFLGTAPVDSATGRAVFDHRFAERGRHSVRAVFNGQEKKDGEGVITEVLEPSTSDPVELDVRPHDVVVENPGPTPDPDPVPDPEPGTGSPDGSGSSGSSGSSGPTFLTSIIGILSSLGVIGQFLISILGLGGN